MNKIRNNLFMCIYVYGLTSYVNEFFYYYFIIIYFIYSGYQPNKKQKHLLYIFRKWLNENKTSFHRQNHILAESE